MIVMPNIPTPGIPIAPPVYFCPRAKGEFVMDGRIDKPFWENVPFTGNFLDISGPDFPVPRFRTRAKMCWDDENLYIAALLEGNEIWANITKRDSVMYYDNDFEVFVDPSSSGHNYMELEMNALNTQWDLILTHPYRDGGRSISCWDIPGVETAVYVAGEVNNPAADNRFWSVEIKLPFKPLMETYSKELNPADLERCYSCRTAPRLGEFWRMNFSRVQWLVDVVDGKYCKRTGADGKWLPEDNWVWAATGLIDIHCPEFWGFVFFTEHGESMEIPADEQRKLDLRVLYYAQYAHYAKHGCFTEDLSKLECSKPAYPVRAEITSRTFLLSCEAEQSGQLVCLHSDGLAEVVAK